jgi:hypothetical protein
VSFGTSSKKHDVPASFKSTHTPLATATNTNSDDSSAIVGISILNRCER